MFISLIIPNLYTNMSTVFLGTFWNQGVTGIFNAGYRFISFTDVIIEVFSRTFYPFLARRMDKHTFYSRIAIWLGLLLSVALFVMAPFIVNFFYEEEFYEATYVIRIMSCSPLFFAIMNVYGTNYLVLKGKENILRNIIILCSLIGIVLSYSLISRYAYIGAAITITSIWFIRSFLTFYYAKRVMV